MFMKNKKIKVAHIVLDLNIGGLEVLVFNIIRKLDKEKFEPIVICLKERGVLGNELKTLGVKVIPMRKGESFEWRCFFKLADILKKESVDVVHLHNARVR